MGFPGIEHEPEMIRSRDEKPQRPMESLSTAAPCWAVHGPQLVPRPSLRCSTFPSLKGSPGLQGSHWAMGMCAVSGGGRDASGHCGLLPHRTGLCVCVDVASSTCVHCRALPCQVVDEEGVTGCQYCSQERPRGRVLHQHLFQRSLG